MILIGSRSLAIRAPKLLERAPVDFDWICTQPEYEKWMSNNAHKVKPTKIYPIMNGEKMIVEGDTNLEFEFIQEGHSNQLLTELVEKDSESLETPFGLIPNLDLLFTIKSSHRFKKFKESAAAFWKTAQDYHKLKLIGSQIRPEYLEFHKLRAKETYNYAHPNLNRSKDQFFSNDEVPYMWEHDDIHKAIALQEKPAYTYFGKEGEEVKSDKAKFFVCDPQIQLNAVIEESCVLAIERSLEMFPGVMTEKQAYAFALAKVCSSITSGWFRTYAHDNIFSALKEIPSNYYERFKEARDAGRVAPFKKAMT